MFDAIALLAAHLERREMVEPGQQTRLARHLGVTPALVHQWLRRIRPIAPRHARGIQEYTEGARDCGVVTRYMIAPDVFGLGPDAAADPDPSDGLPAELKERAA